VDPFGCPLSPIADFDRDGDVDLDDFAYIQACLSGQGVPPAPGCDNADLERDQDVDTNDLALFEPCLSGANVPALPTCLGR